MCLIECADANHTFSSGSVDWGFTTFLPLKEVTNQQKGFLLEDTLEVALCCSDACTAVLYIQ